MSKFQKEILSNKGYNAYGLNFVYTGKFRTPEIGEYYLLMNNTSKNYIAKCNNSFEKEFGTTDKRKTKRAIYKLKEPCQQTKSV